MGIFKEMLTWKSGGFKTTKVTNKKTGKSKTSTTRVGKRPSKSGLSKTKRRK